jgi:membrane associated rhomboid family serine protease
MLVIADNNPIRHISRPYVNWGLIVLCTLIFILQPPYQSFGFVPATLQNAVYGTGLIGKGYVPPPTDWWGLIQTSISYIFLHGSALHLIGNMIALWVFGNNVEDSMGHWRYPLFFILCGMGGAAAEGLFTDNPQIPVVGASGSIAGVMGAYLLLHPRARVLVLVALRVPVLVPASVVVGLTISLDVISVMLPHDGGQIIAFWAHIGGFLTGMALITVMKYRDVGLFQPAAIYPETAFGGLSRLMINLGPRPGSGSESACWRRKLWFWAKTIGFFLAITLIAEMIFA